jgi:hypothetical protein
MGLNLRCATEGCPKNLEHRGGEFIYSREDNCFYCKECFSIPKYMDDCKNLYDFTTRHLNGEPIHVQGKQHLMRLERQYGVSHQQLNNMERNWSVPTSHRPEPMHPELERFMGKAREMGELRGRVEGGFGEAHNR